MNPVTILVIEDEESILELIRDILILEGFHVITATNGKDGLELAIFALPNLILCDVTMPEINGYQVLEELQKRNGFALEGKNDSANANKTVENFQIIDDIVLYDFMNQYCKVHFENQLPGFVVPYAEIQKSYKTFVNSQMESEKDWWKF
jgi:CheY-like chemotaxis protein